MTLFHVKALFKRTSLQVERCEVIIVNCNLSSTQDQDTQHTRVLSGQLVVCNAPLPSPTFIRHQWFGTNIIKQFAAFSSAATKTGPVSASTPAASSRTIGASSPSNKRPTFKTTGTAVRTSASLQQGRKSPALRGTLGSTGYVLFAHSSYCHVKRKTSKTEFLTKYIYIYDEASKVNFGVYGQVAFISSRFADLRVPDQGICRKQICSKTYRGR